MVLGLRVYCTVLSLEIFSKIEASWKPRVSIAI